MKFRITKIDHDGYNGREYHPADSDCGLVVAPVRMSSFYVEHGGCEPVIGDDDRVYSAAVPWLAGDGNEIEPGYVETVWTCVTADGRVLDLVEHEFEVVL